MRMLSKLPAVMAYLCLGCLSAPVQSGDPYLDMLEEEAQVLELMKSAEKLDATAQTGAPDITGDNAARAMLGAGMTSEQFDEVLKTRFVGTYMLYAKLSPEQKEAVYARYQRDGRIMEIRRVIAEHL